MNALKNRKYVPAIVLLSIALLLAGCAEQEILNSFRKYFPAAALWKFDPRVLCVQTDVTNISQDFAQEVFKNFLARTGDVVKLQVAMRVSGYKYMILGFSDFRVIYYPEKGIYWVLDPLHSNIWAYQNLGYTFLSREPYMEIVR